MSCDNFLTYISLRYQNYDKGRNLIFLSGYRIIVYFYYENFNFLYIQLSIVIYS